MNDIKKTSHEADIEEMFVETENKQSMARPAKKRKGAKIFVSFILILVLVFVVLLVVSKVTNVNILGLSKTKVTIPNPAKASDWQAVFLSNGQVYFGKLKGENSNYPTLEDVYYLQVQKVPIQPAQAANNTEGVQPAQKTQDQMILVKFGTELHRPMDKMFINKDHILMYEDLSEASSVVQAIQGYKDKQNEQQTKKEVVPAEGNKKVPAEVPAK